MTRPSQINNKNELPKHLASHVILFWRVLLLQSVESAKVRVLRSELEINRKCKGGGVTPRKNPKQRKRMNRVPFRNEWFLALRLLSSSFEAYVLGDSLLILGMSPLILEETKGVPRNGGCGNHWFDGVLLSIIYKFKPSR